MKKDRSNVYTSGICTTVKETKQFRFLLFELDKEHSRHFQELVNFYEQKRIDVLFHKTGSGGYHFLSPTLIQKHEWKMLHATIKHINIKCPMNTLRTQPNKYPNEYEIWYRFEHIKFKENYQHNCQSMCLFLNHLFGSDFKGYRNESIITVRYPLPYV